MNSPVRLPGTPRLLGPRARTAFYRIHDHAVGGYVYDPDRPGTRFVVEVRVDGEAAALTRAEHFVPRLREGEGGDGCHGFMALLAPGQLQGASRIEAWLANSDDRIGVILHDSDSPGALAIGHVAGAVHWHGGLRLSGYAYDASDPLQPPAVEIRVDGEPIETLRPDRWREARRGDDVPTARIGFEAVLPPTLADGRVHEVRAIAGDGTELEGSPLVVIAHRDGFAGLVGEIGGGDAIAGGTRAKILDTLMPASLPFSHAEEWRRLFPVEPAPAVSARVAVLLIGGGEAEIEASLASLEGQTHTDWFAVAVEADRGAFSSIALAEACAEIAAGEADVALVVAAGTILHAQALGHLGGALAGLDGPGLAYADAVLAGRSGADAMRLKPAFDPWRMARQGYAADIMAMDVSLLAQAAEGAGSAYDLLLGVLRGLGASARERVVHVPEPLADLPAFDVERAAILLAVAVDRDHAQRGIERDVHVQVGRSYPALRFAPAPDHRPAPVSIVIPTRDRADLLRPCVETLRGLTSGVDFELIVVDNGSRDPETFSLFDEIAALGGRVVRADMPFNYPAINNLAVAQASHDIVCLLNNDVEIIDPDWLAALVEPLDDPAVGAVGATLLWPSRMVQHGGVVAGMGFAAAHAFNDCVDGEAGFGDGLLTLREQSAATAACLALRRTDWEALGGMDGLAFPVAFNDVDLCLRLRARGLAVLVSPQARLLHKESASRGLDTTPEKRARMEKELNALRCRWGETLLADPFYHPSLNLDSYPFTGLATPPRARKPRRNLPPAVNRQ